ncbi:MAG: glycogen/starch synthase [Bacteroidaceae bacterium]
MKAKKVLFINQEITPYVPETPMATLGRKLPQSIQDCGHEIRTFLPKWGNINERRNQLHEVIRLSGMNIIIDDTDHPLIIKVASIPVARMQVYFIDNDDYFQKRLMAHDKEGNEYTDNAERAIFYARGVLETVKKLRWCPDIIHCHGWITSIAPFYIKTAYKDEPTFRDAKIVFSLYNEPLKQSLPEDFKDCLQFRNANRNEIDNIGLDFNSYDDLSKLAMKYSDGVVQAEDSTNVDLLQFAKDNEKPVLDFPGIENSTSIYSNFYEEVMN